MIDIRRAGLVVVACAAFAGNGCGGCQEEAPKAAAPAPVAKPTQPPAPPTRAPEQPAPNAAAPGAPAPEDAQDAAADDCFVMMDAFPDYGAPPLKVKFTTEVECNSGQPSFKWDFGDGSGPNTEASPTHVYAKDGDFTATVTVTGPSGGSDSDEMDIVVEKEGKDHKEQGEE